MLRKKTIFLFLITSFIGSTLYSQNYGSYKGLVLDESTMLPICSAKVVIDSDKRIFFSDSMGLVFIDSIFSGEYVIAIQSNEYLLRMKSIIIHNNSTTMDSIFLNKIISNKDYFFDYVFFKEGSSEFIPSEGNNKTINTIVSLLKNESDIVIDIVSYSDFNERSMGDTTLSYQRAKVVRGIIAANNIDINRINICTDINRNERPIIVNTNNNFNYRVEFIIKNKVIEPNQ